MSVWSAPRIRTKRLIDAPLAAKSASPKEKGTKVSASPCSSSVGARTAGKLAAGTTLTMEPGIYLPDRGGVRIEDTVLVGETPQVLTPMTTDLLEIA